MKASNKRSPEEGHQLEATARAKDARHLKEIEELRAMSRSEHDALEAMIQTLEQQLQQQRIASIGS